MKPQFITAILIFLLLPAGLFASGEVLSDFVTSYGCDLVWNPLRTSGTITRNGRTLTFSVGNPWILLDNTMAVHTEPAVFDGDGNVIIPQVALATFKKHFREGPRPVQNIAAIIIDPGHGGKDPGALRTYWIKGEKVVIREKDVVFKFSKMLKRQLQTRYPHKEILITREDDTTLQLGERVEKANGVDLKKGDAVIFVSIHVNSQAGTTGKGFEVWVLPPHVKRTVIKKEDVAAEDEEIVPILNAMLEEEYLLESNLIAREILKQVESYAGDITPVRGIKEEEWFVVKYARMPSVLLELGFVSNREEALRLVDDVYLNKLSTAVYNGLVSFIAQFESVEGLMERR